MAIPIAAFVDSLSYISCHDSIHGTLHVLYRPSMHEVVLTAPLGIIGIKCTWVDISTDY